MNKLLISILALVVTVFTIIFLFSYITGVGIKYILSSPPQNPIINGILRGKDGDKDTMWIRARYISHRETSYVDSNDKKSTIAIVRALVTFDGRSKSIIHIFAGGVINTRAYDPYVDKETGETESKKIVLERVPLSLFLKTFQTQPVFNVSIIISNPDSYNPIICIKCPLFPKVVDTQYEQSLRAFITNPGVVLDLLVIPTGFSFE